MNMDGHGLISERNHEKSLTSGCFALETRPNQHFESQYGGRGSSQDITRSGVLVQHHAARIMAALLLNFRIPTGWCVWSILWFLWWWAIFTSILRNAVIAHVRSSGHMIWKIKFWMLISAFKIFRGLYKAREIQVVYWWKCWSLLDR